MRIFSVSEFVAEINAIIATDLYVIEGEVSDFRVSQGKWVFFDLKDEKKESKVGCFLSVWRLKVQIEDGMRVRVIGYPRVHEKSGQFRVNVETVEPVGEGALKRAFELLKKKLAAEGLFALERKRPLPRFPARIGLIASRESAAYTDFMRILGNRWGGVEVCLAHVQVQGERAVFEIVEAIKNCQPTTHNLKPKTYNLQALVLIRGGGSLEDLAAFNSEEVARAIFGSKIPVVVGVGHERDETIADYVADVRASTPSNAAERVVPDRREVGSEIEFMAEQMERTLSHSIVRRCHAVASALQTIEAHVLSAVHRGRELFQRFGHAIEQVRVAIAHKRSEIESVARLLAGLDPKRLLARGYSIVRNKAGHVIKDAAAVDIGEEIGVQLGRGSLGAEVVSK